MVIDLAAHRAKRIRSSLARAAYEEHERLCVNGGLARVIPVQAAVAVEPIPSPTLADIEADYAAYHTLAYALATQL